MFATPEEWRSPVATAEGTVKRKADGAGERLGEFLFCAESRPRAPRLQERSVETWQRMCSGGLSMPYDDS